MLQRCVAENQCLHRPDQDEADWEQSDAEELPKCVENVVEDWRVSHKRSYYRLNGILQKNPHNPDTTLFTHFKKLLEQRTFHDFERLT